jgi:hypothetical protein
MPTAGGINSQLGFAEESTPGTAVTPSRFGEFDKESLSQDFARSEHSGLRTGRKLLGANNYAVGRESFTGDLQVVMQTLGQAVFYKHALGAVVTTTPGGGTLSRQHKATVGAIDGKGLTMQIGFTDDAGTTRAKTGAGCKVSKWEIACKSNDYPSLKLSMDGMSSSVATALATASYPTPLADYFWTQAVVKVAGAAVDCSEWKISGDNHLALDRYFMRTTGTQKKEQLEGADLREITGELTLAFPDLTAYNRFVNNTQASLQITFTGSIIEAAIPFSVDFLMAAVRFDGNTPIVDGVGLIPVVIPFKVIDTTSVDGPFVATVVNTDTTA